MATSSSQADANANARNEFTSAVRIGIEALMNQCGYSRERAIAALLKELNRNNNKNNKNKNIGSPYNNKPTDDEIFETMRKHKLGIEEANNFIVVSRAVGRELVPINNQVTGAEAIHRLISKISLDNILYESEEDDLDDDDVDDDDCKDDDVMIQHDELTTSESALPIIKLNVEQKEKDSFPTLNKNKNNNSSIPSKVEVTRRVSSSPTPSPSSSSGGTINVNTASSTSTSTISNGNNNRKSARNKKLTSPSPRKRVRSKNPTNNNNTNNNTNNNNNNNNNNTILIGRKRSIEDINTTNGEGNVDGPPTRRTTRSSKRLHRSSSSSSSSSGQQQQPAVDGKVANTPGNNTNAVGGKKKSKQKR